MRNAMLPSRRQLRGMKGCEDEARQARAEKQQYHPTPFRVANRVFHQKFGTGSVTAIDGNTSGVNFNKVGDKRGDLPWRADDLISQPSHHSTLRHGRCAVARQLPTQL